MLGFPISKSRVFGEAVGKQLGNGKIEISSEAVVVNFHETAEIIGIFGRPGLEPVTGCCRRGGGCDEEVGEGC
jgi:hypothetical protein